MNKQTPVSFIFSLVHKKKKQYLGKLKDFDLIDTTDVPCSGKKQDLGN